MSAQPAEPRSQRFPAFPQLTSLPRPRGQTWLPLESFWGWARGWHQGVGGIQGGADHARHVVGHPGGMGTTWCSPGFINQPAGLMDPSSPPARVGPLVRHFPGSCGTCCPLRSFSFHGSRPGTGWELGTPRFSPVSLAVVLCSSVRPQESHSGATISLSPILPSSAEL